MPFCAAWPLQSAARLTHHSSIFSPPSDSSPHLARPIAHHRPTHDPQIALTAPRPSFASPADQAKTAILALADRTGSSLIAIKKYLNVAPDKNRFLNAGLAAGVKNGTFIKVKGSFKVSPAAKKPAKKKAAPKKVRCGVVVCGVWR